MKSMLMSIFLPAIILVVSSAHAAEPLRHVRIEVPNAQELSLHLQHQGFDVLEGSVTDHQLEVIVSVAGLQDLLAAGYAPTTLAVGRPFRDIQTERIAELSVPEGYPADPAMQLIENDFDWAATNRAAILKKWSERYDGKSLPKK